MSVNLVLLDLLSSRALFTPLPAEHRSAGDSDPSQCSVPAHCRARAAAARHGIGPPRDAMMHHDFEFKQYVSRYVRLGGLTRRAARPVRASRPAAGRGPPWRVPAGGSPRSQRGVAAAEDEGVGVRGPGVQPRLVLGRAGRKVDAAAGGGWRG